MPIYYAERQQHQYPGGQARSKSSADKALAPQLSPMAMTSAHASSRGGHGPRRRVPETRTHIIPDGRAFRTPSSAFQPHRPQGQTRQVSTQDQIQSLQTRVREIETNFDALERECEMMMNQHSIVLTALLKAVVGMGDYISTGSSDTQVLANYLADVVDIDSSDRWPVPQRQPPSPGPATGS